MRARPTSGLVASPVLVGAVTVLVVMISVFLAYNANSGLPFVPTYDVRAEIPGGSNLVEGNEVRLGGFRVGVVDSILPGVASAGERAEGQEPGERAIAVIDMKLDKSVEELPADTGVQIRPRSALGLKYISLELGSREETIRAGDTIPLEQSMKPIEIDEFFGIQNAEFRTNLRKVYEGYGTALSGRGNAINDTIRDAKPLLRRLEPVFRNLSDPDTELDNFFLQAGRFSAQIAPVADTYRSLFTNMGTTFEALSRNETSLQDTIERLRPTLDTGIDSFPVQRPFLRDSAILARNLLPVAIQIERSLPLVSDAFVVGAPVQAKAPLLYRNTEKVFNSLEGLAANPNTLIGLSQLRRTLQVATPLVQYVAPFQTVCNYWVYYWSSLGEHVSEIVPEGMGQRSLSKSGTNVQDDRVGTTDGDRPVDVPEGMDPKSATDSQGQALQALHGGAYSRAIDAQGNADCETGQKGYLAGPSSAGKRYPSSPDPEQSGGSHIVTDVPGLAGPTYKGLELNIDNLEDVP